MYGYEMTMQKLEGKTIRAAWKADDLIEFDVGEPRRLAFSCEGDCCAHAYFYQCENMEWLVGSPVLSVDRRELPSVEDEGGYTDSETWAISTAKGTATIEMRTEHNGYYCGYVTNATERLLGEDARVA